MEECYKYKGRDFLWGVIELVAVVTLLAFAALPALPHFLSQL